MAQRYYRNPETGELEEITEECYQMMRQYTFRPNPKIGKMILFGTMAEIDGLGNASVRNLRDMFIPIKQ